MASTGSFDGTLVPLDWFDDTTYPLGWFDRDLGSVATGGGSTLTLSPTTGHQVVLGKTPSLQQTTTLTLSPTTGHQVVLGKTPTLVLSSVLSPTTGHQVQLGKTPTVSQSSSSILTLSPTTGHQVVLGKTPTLSQTTTITLSPSTGHQVVSGRTPILAQTANQIIVPSTGHVTIQGNVPQVEQSAPYTITLDSLRKLADIWTRLGLNISTPVTISTSSIAAGAMDVQITEAGGIITCTRQDSTHASPADADLMIDEVYKRMGLDPANPMATLTSEVSSGSLVVQLSGTSTVVMQRQ